MKYEIQRTSQFKKDYKLAVKRGLNISKLKYVISMLAEGEELPEEYSDHCLQVIKNVIFSLIGFWFIKLKQIY